MEPLNLMVSLSHFANTEQQHGQKQSPKHGPKHSQKHSRKNPQDEHGLAARVRRRRARKVAAATNVRRVLGIRVKVLP
jgi:hypothetical protein